jgi:hypothetical protein
MYILVAFLYLVYLVMLHCGHKRTYVLYKDGFVTSKAAKDWLKKNEGKFVYFQDLRASSVLLQCAEHKNCPHVVKVGPCADGATFCIWNVEGSAHTLPEVIPNSSVSSVTTKAPVGRYGIHHGTRGTPLFLQYPIS